MSKLEAFPFAHTEQAHVNREKHLYPFLKRAGAIGAIALTLTGAARGIEAAAEQKFVDETTVTVHNGETAIAAIYEGNEIIADQHGYDPETVSGVIEQGQKIGSFVANGQQIKVRVIENGFGQKSIDATNITNIPRQ